MSDILATLTGITPITLFGSNNQIAPAVLQPMIGHAVDSSVHAKAVFKQSLLPR